MGMFTRKHETPPTPPEADPHTPTYLGYGIVPYEDIHYIYVEDEEIGTFQDRIVEVVRVQGNVFRDKQYIIIVDAEGGTMYIPRERVHPFCTHDNEETFTSYAMHSELEMMTEGDDD